MDNNQSNFIYHSDLPYPNICAGEINSSYAMEMLDNIGGQNSEMSAVSLYFYNDLVTNKDYEEVSLAFHKISIVEMHHLEIFGRLSLQLGANPRLWTYVMNRTVYWTPSYNKYSMDLSTLLLNAIQGETQAINKYNCQISKIKNINIIENLKRIIIDEQLHIDIFNKLYNKYVCAGKN